MPYKYANLLLCCKVAKTCIHIVSFKLYVQKSTILSSCLSDELEQMNGEQGWRFFDLQNVKKKTECDSFDLNQFCFVF